MSFAPKLISSGRNRRLACQHIHRDAQFFAGQFPMSSAGPSGSQHRAVACIFLTVASGSPQRHSAALRVDLRSRERRIVDPGTTLPTVKVLRALGVRSIWRARTRLTRHRLRPFGHAVIVITCRAAVAIVIRHDAHARTLRRLRRVPTDQRVEPTAGRCFACPSHLRRSTTDCHVYSGRIDTRALDSGPNHALK